MSENHEKEETKTRESIVALAKSSLNKSNSVDFDDEEQIDEDEMNYEERTIENSKDQDEIEREVASKEAQDMLEEFHNKRVRKGFDMTLKVVKNGKILCTLENQIVTWDRLHKEYGEGTLKVTSWYFNHKNKKITQTQTQVFGPYQPIKLNNIPHEENTNVMPTKDTNMNDTFMLMQKAQQDAEDRAERRAQQTITLLKEVIAPRSEAPKNDNTMEFMKLMMEMNQKAEERTQKLISDMNEKHEKALEKTQAQLDRMMQENTRTIERIMDSVNNKEEGPDALKIQEMIDRAKREGQEESDRIHALIEEKAELIAKKQGGKDNKEEKDESILDKTIKSFLPLAPQILSKVMAPSPSAPMMPNQNNATIVSTTSKPVQKQLPPPQRTIQQAKQVTSSQVKKSDNVVRKGGMVTVLPTPKAKVEEKNNSAKIPNVANDKKNAEIEQKVISIASPLILSGLMNEIGSLKTASEVREALLSVGINAHDACKVVTLQKVNDLANTNGLFQIAEQQGKREELSTWLKTFYEELSKASV